MFAISKAITHIESFNIFLLVIIFWPVTEFGYFGLGLPNDKES